MAEYGQLVGNVKLTVDLATTPEHLGQGTFTGGDFSTGKTNITGVILQFPLTNPGNVEVGAAGVDAVALNGMTFEPGDISPFIMADDLQNIWCDAVVNNSVVKGWIFG